MHHPLTDISRRPAGAHRTLEPLSKSIWKHVCSETVAVLPESNSLEERLHHAHRRSPVAVLQQILRRGRSHAEHVRHVELGPSTRYHTSPFKIGSLHQAPHHERLAVFCAKFGRDR